MTAALLLLLKLAVGGIILAIGLDSTPRDLTYLWRRPGLLLRSLLAMYLLVPLTTLAAVALLNLPPGVEMGLVVLAVSAGAPLLPRKLLKIGDGAYIFSLVVTSSLLAIVLVPVWLAVVGPWLGHAIELGPVQVALILAKSFFVPLALGMLVRWRFPTLAERIGRMLMAVAGLVLTVSAVVLLSLHWDLLLQAGWPGVATLAGLILAALAVGHLLGGPAPEDRTALAIACATRHLGIAVLVAASLPGPRAAVIVAVYLLTSALISVPYLRWRSAAARSTHPRVSTST
jgi:predicted Na+-dependent transporter